MMLLQAAIAAGMFLFYIALPVFLLLVTPFILGVLMRFTWRRLGKQEYVQNKMPYYKDRECKISL
jgi:ACR3 family arsenite efflux pump ArsB